MRNRRTYTPLGAEPSKLPLDQTPFPGLIDGKRWRVQEGRWPAFIERSGEEWVMQVPLDDSDVARKLRLHEEAHIAWTPEPTDKERKKFGVEARTLDSCEDGRIIEMMGRRSPDDWRVVNTSADMLPEVLLARHRLDFARLAEKLSGRETKDPDAPPMRTISLVEAARLIASSRGYFEANHFDEMAHRNGLAWVTEAVKEMHHRHIASKKEPTFADTVEYARELEHYFSLLEEQMINQNAVLREAELPPDLQPRENDENLHWGRLRIERAPLTEKLRGDPSRKVRPADIGAVPRYMHRLTTDQRVFGRQRKRKVHQGTVLIDHSGSMNLRPEEVDEMLRRWPAVTIATYCGRETNGVLRIVAHRGKRASQQWLDRPSAGANVVDGPALDWLGKQKGPRIWISDGQVSGVGENFHPWFKLDAARKVVRGKIKRIEDVQSLLGS